MNVKTYYRGHYPRGYGIKCKHCGNSYEAHHGSPGDVRNPALCLEGFTISFSECGPLGYEPQNLKEWIRIAYGVRELSEQERSDRFKMEWYERQAQGEAAWGMYAAQVRTQNYRREKSELEEKVSRVSSDQERRAAEERLGGFLETTRRNAGTLYIGSGVGRSDPDDD